MSAMCQRDESLPPLAMASLQAHRKVYRRELKSAIVSASHTLQLIEGLKSNAHEPLLGVKAARANPLDCWFQPISQGRNHDKGRLTWHTSGI